MEYVIDIDPRAHNEYIEFVENERDTTIADELGYLDVTRNLINIAEKSEELINELEMTILKIEESGSGLYRYNQLYQMLKDYDRRVESIYNKLPKEYREHEVVEKAYEAFKKNNNFMLDEMKKRIQRGQLEGG